MSTCPSETRGRLGSDKDHIAQGLHDCRQVETRATGGRNLFRDDQEESLLDGHRSGPLQRSLVRTVRV